jgi:methionyl-tRNA formyltransferase
MRLGVAATPEVAIPTLEWLLHSDHEIALIITQPDKPAGRGRAMKQSVVADWAELHSIPIIKPHAPLDLIGSLETLDCVITIGYGVLLHRFWSCLSMVFSTFTSLYCQPIGEQLPRNAVYRMETALPVFLYFS